MRSSSLQLKPGSENRKPNKLASMITLRIEDA
jgi:hypothetical protein